MAKNKLTQVLKFLKHFYIAKNRYGVHSPYVYKLLTNCIYDKTRYPEYKIWEAYRKQLMSSHQFLEVKDAGAGSKVFHSAKRSVSDMARLAGSSKRKARLLFRLARYLQAENILELGTHLGLGTMALALAGKDFKVTTIDADENLMFFAREQFKNYGIDNVQWMPGFFDEVLPELTSNKKYDLIFLDGNHRGDATLKYVEMLKSAMHDETVLVLDDIHWSGDMEQAWKKLIRDDFFHVSADLFFVGLLVPRPFQQKEHFIIRFF